MKLTTVDDYFQKGDLVMHSKNALVDEAYIQKCIVDFELFQGKTETQPKEKDSTIA